MADTLEYIDRQFARLKRSTEEIVDLNNRQFVQALCDAGLKVKSQEGKLAAYALACAATEGVEGLQSFLGVVGQWMGRENEDEAVPVKAN